MFFFLVECFGQTQTITAPRALVALTGDLKSAILLSQIIYWSKINANQDGWFYKTYDEWSVEIALSKHEVARSVDQLVAEETVETKVAKVNGTPKVHYRFLTSGFRKWIVKKGEVDSEERGSQIVKKGEVYKEQKSTTEEYVQKETNANFPLDPTPENQETAIGKFSDGSEYDPETGEEIKPPQKLKKQWGRKKEPKPSPEADRRRQQREAMYANAGSVTDRLSPMATAPSTTNGTPAINFPSLWNAAVPKRPIDPSLLAPNPKAYREPAFALRFSDICQKAKSLIDAGAELEFGFLLSIDRNTDQYRWQQLLAGQLDWMKPRGKNGKPKDDFVDRMKKEFGL